MLHPHHAAPPGHASDARVLRVGDCELDLVGRRLLRRGVPVPLRPPVFELLRLLVERSPETVGRDELRTALWGRREMPANAIARAALEARRALQDPSEAPRLIVNVRGVGYRFAGRPSEAATLRRGAMRLVADDPCAHLEKVELACWQHRDLARARQHAEQALAGALRLELREPMAEALGWLASLADAAGAMEEALRHLSLALQLTQDGASEMQRARTWTVEAQLLLSLGDPVEAKARLLAALPTLTRGRHRAHRQRCEHLLAVASRHLGERAAALQWCLQSQRSARAAGLERLRVQALVEHVRIGFEHGVALDETGQPGRARRAWTSALELSARLCTPATSRPDPDLLAECLGLQVRTLARLGRPDAAWRAQAALERLIDRQPDAPMGGLPTLRMLCHLEQARLCLREGRAAQALDLLQAALSQAQGTPAAPWHPELYELAASAAEAARQPELALRWLRAQHTTHKALESAQALALVRALEIRSAHDATRVELERLRGQVRLLERDIANALLHPHDS